MNNKRAFTLTEILIVVAIIGLLAAIGVPFFGNAIRNSEDRAKNINIAGVEAAKEQWALLNNKPVGTDVNWSDIQSYMGSNVTNKNDLNVNSCGITINPVGTRAAYN